MSRSSHRTAWLGALALSAACCVGSLGCAAADMAEEAWFQSTQALRPTTRDYADPTETLTDDWSEAGEIGRADQEPTRDDESWYNQIFKSAKTRDIERNLGYDVD
jgi:hypothetical protein